MPFLRPLSVPRLGFEGDLQYQNGRQPPPYYLGNYLVNLKRIKRC